ncbi:cold-inducible protein YdjO-related protein [Paenibacillus taihuensis]|uniref:cold-inducible protein YdjO-related protein n=1 Tax=Paenibacillus taihuensis TaxID=1156355 RepID=UPI000E27F021|nr:cold-inducible protein YdjO-related protein [Paenibacillus taihuensis]
MYRQGKKPVSEHVYADTSVWQCPQCVCWSRVEFITAEKPQCPSCHTSMSLKMKNIRIE